MFFKKIDKRIKVVLIIIIILFVSIVLRVFKIQVFDYKKLKISLLLNALNSLRTKGKLDANVQTILLWKLPKSMASYIRILLTKFYTEVKCTIIECYKTADIDDEVVDRPEGIFGKWVGAQAVLITYHYQLVIKMFFDVS